MTRCWIFILEGTSIFFFLLIIQIYLYCYLIICSVNLYTLLNLLCINSDITALAKDKAYTQISLDEMSIHQVISKCIFLGTSFFILIVVYAHWQVCESAMTLVEN